jgi:DNA/RNA endonuclease YhcR with UshA esterase domain
MQLMKRSLSVLFSFTFVFAALIGVYLVIQPAAQAAPNDIMPISSLRSLPLGTVVTVTGRATMYTGGFYAGSNTKFYIQDDTGGVEVFCYSSRGTLPAVTIGDLITVTGALEYYRGELEVVPANNVTNLQKTDGSPADAPSPLAKAISEVDNDDAALGWLVEIDGTATRVQTYTNSYEMDLSDGQGHTALIYLDKLTGANVNSVQVGGRYIVIGISELFSNTGTIKYELKPRQQSDIALWSDTTPPVVSSTVPISNAADVNPYQPISAVFSERLNPATVNTASFTLTNASGSVAGNVSYASSTFTADFAPVSSLAPLTVYTATLTTAIQDLAGNLLAAPYVWAFTTSAADTTPPTIVARFPAVNAISVPLSSSIVLTFSEDLQPSTVIPANFTLIGPSGSIGWSGFTYAANTDRLVLTPIAFTSLARYTVTISSGVTDWAGNPLAGSLSWSFTTATAPEMSAFHGDLHNHTSYSDGSLTAATAYATGKANGFDFMAVTDHSYAVDDNEWAQMLQAANDATIPGQFVALRGVEYTQGAEGHINVINSVRHPVRSNTGCAYCDYTPNLEKGVTVDGFYNWLAVTGTQSLDSGGVIAQFNHPGWINFNDWTYHPEVSASMKLEEVGNGSGVSYAFSEDEYIRSLDYGWKVGATNNADTHSPYWGSNTPHRTGVWMPTLTKADLMAALQARRTFATEDTNYELGFKGNGAWLGSEIPNTGSIAFEITGFDPDGEGAALVQLISFGGEVITQTTMPTPNFTWNPIVPVDPGVHYFYAKVTQPDEDRIVSSPIWTTANVNLSITDLSVEPTIATIYNPSLITARISNRMDTTQTVTVTYFINNTPQAVLTTTVPRCLAGPCVDAYPAITWQPSVTGPVTITAIMTGAPAGDNPDDNTRTTTMNATDEKVPLVLIDAGHGNIASTPRDVRTFVNDLTAHGYNVLLNLDQITASDLNTETVKLLIINAFGPDQLQTSELQAVGDFVNAGGSLWLNGIADYAGKIAWAGNSSTILNGLVSSIESSTGYTIPIRLNSDEVLDGNDNNGYPWGVLWHIFPAAPTSGIGMNAENIQSWSLCSLTDGSGQALTQSDLGANGFIAALGDEDAGNGTYNEPNRTHNENSDATVPAFIYTAGNSVPAAAGYDIPGPAGRMFFYGDANDPFNIFAYTAGDGKQNELFNLQTVMWLLGEPITKTTIAQARAYSTVNQPEKLDQLVWVEGKITAAFGEFFNVLYVQDETGGITVHAPAGDIDAADYARGVTVRVLGTIGIYEGDTEIEFYEAEQVQILTPTGTAPAPLPFSTHAAALEANQGWLTQITGTVKSKNAEALVIDDGSGPVRAFLDGYNGVWDDVKLFDQITVKGLISEDYNGPRIRLRNHGMHPLIADDVAIISHAKQVFLPLIRR